MTAKKIHLPVRKYEPWIDVDTGMLRLGKYQTIEEAQVILDEITAKIERAVKILDSGIANA